MKTIKLKEKHFGTVIDRILAADRQRLYVENLFITVPSENGENMPDYEKKEYMSLLNDYNNELEELKKYILDNKQLFDLFLSEYNTNVEEFLS